MALASPGVLVKEVDFTATVQVADQNIGVVAIDAERGPTDQVTYVSSERQLVETFGNPNNNNFESWFAAATLIQYGAVVAVIRPTGATDLGLNNANIKQAGTPTSSASLVIKNKDDFESTVTKDYTWASRTAGKFNNDVQVVVVDHGADQRVTVTPVAGQVTDFDGATGAGATAGRTAGTYTIVATSSGGGTGATFSVVIAAGGAATITKTKNGSGYADNDTLTLPRAGAYGGATDITVTVNGVNSDLPAAGSYVKWTDANSVDQKGNVFKAPTTTSLEITLWDGTKRLTGNEVLKNADGDTVATVTAIESNDVYGDLTFASNRKWSSLAPQPGTSTSASSVGGKFDEMHIAVLDVKGTVSGVPGTVLETLTFVSKASNAKSAEGSATYYKTVVADGSEYIYPGDVNPAGAAGANQLTLAGAAAGTNVNIGSAQGSTFKLFSFGGSSVGKLTLAEGDDYDYSTDSKIASVRAGLVSGYDLVEDPEVFGDIDFLVPGHISTSVVAKLIAIAEKRRDCVVVASPERSDVVNSSSTSVKTDNVIGFFRTLPSTSYAMYDSGYKYIYDKYNDVYRYVPCAADVAGLCVATSNNAETWFSPAGYNRGQIRNATKLAYSPKQAERDRLYTDRINPIVAFPGQGIVLFGDKTALASPSAFDRINVRRLFIELEKNIANFSKYQLFEINDELTRSGFRSAIEPYLRGVQGRRGIYDFLVVCDTTNNTPDVIDRNELVAEIFIKPARTINYITITFVATRTGVSFNELTN